MTNRIIDIADILIPTIASHDRRRSRWLLCIRTAMPSSDANAQQGTAKQALRYFIITQGVINGDKQIIPHILKTSEHIARYDTFCFEVCIFMLAAIGGSSPCVCMLGGNGGGICSAIILLVWNIFHIHCFLAAEKDSFLCALKYILLLQSNQLTF